MSRVLITGVAGFIGMHLAEFLIHQNVHEIVGIDNFVRGTKDERFLALARQKNCRFIEGDLNSQRFVESLPGNIDYVIHLAAINGTENFYNIPYDVAVSCAIPTWHLIDKYRRSGLRKFIFAGTPESYAASTELGVAPIPTSEEAPLAITSPKENRWSYAAGKTFSEVLLCNASHQLGLKYLILRLHNVYGPRMGPHHFIPDFLARLAKGDYTIYGAENTRSFLFVEDAVQDIASLFSMKDAENLILNIGAMEEVTIKQVAEEIMRICGIDNELKVHEAPSNSASRRVPNTEKIDLLLGARSRVPLRQGLSVCIKEFGLLPKSGMRLS